jgi:hypothetical protein
MTCYLERQHEKIKEMAKDPDKKKYDRITEHEYPQSW